MSAKLSFRKIEIDRSVSAQDKEHKCFLHRWEQEKMIILRNFYKSVMYLLVHTKLLHIFAFQSIRIDSDSLVSGNQTFAATVIN
jgi:hypothetical protein